MKKSAKDEIKSLIIMALLLTLLFTFLGLMGLADRALSLPRAGPSETFTWEGEFDPNIFTKWEVAEAKMINPGIIMAIVQNPDKKAEVQKIQMTIHTDGTLLSYRYFKRSEIYEYKINIDNNKYKRMKYTEKKRLSCIICHPEVGEKI